MLRYFGHSLRARLLLAIVVAGGLVLAILVANGMRLAEQHLQTQTKIRIQAVQLAYRTAVALPLVSRDYATLRDILDGWRQADDVLYLAVTDVDGRLVANSGWPPDKPLPAAGTTPGVEHVVFPVELGGQVYGAVHFGLSTAFIDQAKHELFVQGAAIAGFGLLFLILALSMAIYYLTRGLILLAEASARVSRGDFSQRVPVRGQDEVAVLADSFNTMTEAVQSRIRALEESEQRFRAIADYTYAWENWFGPDGRLRWVNPAVQRISGYTPEECLALPDFPLPLVHPQDREIIRRQMQEALAGQSGQDLEFRIQRRDGQSIWAAMSWQPIHDAQGASLGYRSSIRDITVQHQAIAELAHQATHDPLTGLHNRRAFEQHLEKMLRRPAREGSSVVILYLDLDQFKVVNDTCGHVAGDQLLIGLSRMLQSRVGSGFLARLGGDEFGIVLVDCDEAEAMRRASLLIDAIHAYPFSYEGQTFQLGASVGVASAGPGRESVTELLMAADTACYAAKERGRNRVERYTEDDAYFRLRHEEFRSIGHITNALAEGRFQLYYQRLEPLHPGLGTHVEVLIRLLDWVGKIQPPARFIPAAERFNLMPYIDRWVVENVCRQIADWDATGYRPPISRFAVNVSGASLTDREFPAFVQGQIAQHGVDPARLCFEITESCAVAQLEPALEFIDRMHALGAALSLDDFGTGLSSFAYLKQFKVDYLKIDGLFVKHLDTDASDRAVVEAMVQLARVHGLKTVAEFVCNETIFRTVQDIGVDYAQGYARHVPEPLAHLGKPPAAPAG